MIGLDHLTFISLYSPRHLSSSLLFRFTLFISIILSPINHQILFPLFSLRIFSLAHSSPFTFVIVGLLSTFFTFHPQSYFFPRYRSLLFSLPSPSFQCSLIFLGFGAMLYCRGVFMSVLASLVIDLIRFFSMSSEYLSIYQLEFTNALDIIAAESRCIYSLPLLYSLTSPLPLLLRLLLLPSSSTFSSTSPREHKVLSFNGSQKQVICLT